tara:strand:- start:17034 stop:31094 length:14061 start_codon:yes stop_codon:yes gene_type:complete
MAEELTPDLTNFSTTEELPVDNQLTEQEEEKKEDISPDISSYAPVARIKGQSAIKEMSPTPLGNLGLGLGDSKWDFHRKHEGLTLEQAVDINETRGRRQSKGDKWANGMLKALGKTGTNLVGGTIGAIYGAASGLYNLEFDKVFNNSFANSLDNINEWMDNKLPNYYTKYEREAEFWRRAGTANFWSDQFMNGMSFVAGAALTEMAWVYATGLTFGAAAPIAAAAHARNMARLKRIFKVADRGADANKLKELTRAAQQTTLLRQGGNLMRQIYTGAGYEAGVEARGHYDHLKQALIDKAKLENGGKELSETELEKIEKVARASSNGVFTGNLLLVGGGNMLMLSKLYGPGHAIKKGWNKAMSSIIPGFGKGVRVAGKGASKKAQAAYKTSRLGQALGVPQKAQEFINKGLSRTKAALKVPLYEGFVEEGGQSVIDKAAYNYNMLKYGPEGQKTAVSLLEATRQAGMETYGSDDGMTEVMLGFLIGAIGLPGASGSLTNIQQQLKDVGAREDLQDFMADYYNKNVDLLAALKSQGEFMTETQELSNLMDHAMAEGNLAAWKDLENDQLFSYVKSKIMSGQFADIVEDAESLRNLSDEQFMELFDYNKEDFKSSADISKRKNKVADDVIKRANKIKEGFDAVDGMFDFGKEKWTNEEAKKLRESMAHSLSVIENVSEREKALTYALAELTGGRVVESQDTKNKGAARTIVYGEGENSKSFTLSDFSSSTDLHNYKKYQKVLKDIDSGKMKESPIPGKSIEEARAIIADTLEQLRVRIDQFAGSPEVDITELTAEELDLLSAFLPQMEEWGQNDPAGYGKNLKEALQLIKDLRHLRARRHEFIGNFNNLMYGPKVARDQHLQEIERYIEDIKNEEGVEGLMDPEARELFQKFGPNAKFKVNDKFYRFTPEGILYEDGDKNQTPVDPSILRGIAEQDIITTEKEKATKLLDALKKLKEKKGEKIKELHNKIAEEEEKILQYLIELEEEYEGFKQDTKGRYRKDGKFISSKKVQELKEFHTVLNELIKESELAIKETQELVDEIVAQQDYITELVEKHYDPEQGIFTMDFDATYELSKQVRMTGAELLGLPIIGDMESGKSLQEPADHIKKSKEIIDGINEVVDAAKTNIAILQEKIFELKQTRNDLEQILIRKLKEAESGLQSVQGKTLDEIYVNNVSNADKTVAVLEAQEEEDGVPQEQRKSTPLRRLLNIIYETGGKGLTTFSEYRTFIEDNPGILDPLDVYLQDVFKVNNALNDANFLKQELDLLDNEISNIKNLINEIRSDQGNEADADQTIQLANSVIEAGRFQTIMDELTELMLELEEEILKPIANKDDDSADPSDPKPSDTTTDPNPPTDGNNTNNDKNTEKDNKRLYTMSVESPYLYSSTTGMHNTHLERYRILGAKKSRTTDEEKEYKHHKNQLKFYRALNAYHPYRVKKGSKQATVSLMAVSANDLNDPNLDPRIKEALKDSFYNEDTGKFDDTGSMDAQKADIKLVMVYTNSGQPYLVTEKGKNSNKGTVAFTSAKRSTTELETEDGQVSRFSNPLERPQEEYDALVEEKSNAWAQWRANTLNKNYEDGVSVLNKIYRINEVSVGMPNFQENKLFPAKGRVGQTNLDQVDLKIAKNVNKTTGRATITLGKKGKARSLDVNPGFVYVEKNGGYIPFKVRTLESSEADNVTNILRKIAENRAQATKEAEEQGLKGAEKTNYIKDRLHIVEGVDLEIPDLIRQVRNVVFMGNVTSKNKDHYKPEYRLSYDRNKKGYLYGLDGFISNQQLVKNDAKAIAEFKNFLLTKYHQVDAAMVNASRTKEKGKKATSNPYTHLVLDNNLNVNQEKTKTYKNYVEYLLENEGRDTAPPLQVSVPQDDEGIEAPQFKYRKVMFDANQPTKRSTAPVLTPEDTSIANETIGDEAIEGAHPTQTESLQLFTPVLNLLGEQKAYTLPSTPDFPNGIKITPIIVDGKVTGHKAILNYFQIDPTNPMIESTFPKGLTWDQTINLLKKDFAEYKQDPWTVGFEDFLAFKYHADMNLEQEKENYTLTDEQIERDEELPSEDPSPTPSTNENIDETSSSTTDLSDLISENTEPSEVDVTDADNFMDDFDPEGDVNLDDEADMAYVDSIEVQNRDNQQLIDEIKNATRMLPWNEIIKVIGVINRNNRRSYGRVLGHGKTLVSTIGPGGVAYHETFHQVSLYILSKESREGMYSAVKNLKGKGRPGFGKEMKSFKDFTNREAEEWLAEEFRKYILSNGTRDLTKYETAEKGFFKRIFDLIKNFLRTHLGLSNTLQPDPSMAEVQRLFENINAGKYAESKPDTRNDLDAVAEMAILEGKSATDSVELMNNISMYLGKQLFNDNPITSADIELLTDPTRKQEFSRTLKLKYTESIKDLKKDLYQLAAIAKKKGNITLYANLVKDLRYIQDNTRYLFRQHRNFIMQFGLDYNIEMDDVALEQDRSKDVYNILDSFNFSTVTNANPLIKLMIGTLPGERSQVTGLPSVVDYTKTMNFLKEKLTNTTTISQQIEVLKALEPNRPYITELLKRLGDIGNTGTMSYDELKTHNLFAQEFTTTKNKFITYLIDERGNFHPIDSNKQQINGIIGRQWKSNLMAKIGTMLKQEDGVNVIDLDYKIPIKSLGVKLSIRDLQNNPKKLKEIQGPALIDFYSAMGITFSNPDALLDNNNKLNEESLPVILTDTFSWIISQLDDNTKDSDLFSRDHLNITTKLGKLIEAELLHNDTVVELRHFTPEGKPVYGITLHNYMSMVLSDLNKGILPRHLEGNPHALNSLLIKHSQQGGQTSINVIQGLDTRNSKQGSLTSKLSPGDRLAIMANSLLQKNPISSLLRTADGKTEYGITLPESTPSNILKANKIYKGYFKDELQLARNLNADGIGSDVNYFRNEAQGLRIFDSIVNIPSETKQHKLFKADLTKALNGTMNVDEFMESNGDYVAGLTRKYLKKEAKTIRELLHKNRIIEDVSLVNNGLDPQLLQKLFNLDGPAPKTLSQNQVNKIAEAIALRTFIGHNEQLKVLFGDPAFYKALYKRTKGLIGTKKFARVDNAIDNWLNQPEFRRWDGKEANGTFNVSVSADPVTTVDDAYYIELIRYLGKEKADKYTNIEEADAQAYASMDFYREFLIRVGDWSQAQEDLFQEIMSNPDAVVPSKTLFETFPVLKPQYFGPQITNNPIYAPYFMKLSLAPIFPQMATVNGERTQLADLIEDMNNTQTDIKIFPTGVKVGHRVGKNGKAPNFYNKDGSIAKIEPNLRSILDFKYMGIQVDISPKPKTTSTVGTQARTHLLANMYNGGVPVDFDNGINEWNLLTEKQKNEESPVYKLTQEYKRLHSELVNRSKNRILDRFNLVQEGNKYKLKDGDLKSFTEFIQEEIASRQWPENIAAGVNFLLKQNQSEAVFDILVNKDRIESLLFSIIGNNVVTQKFKGDLRVQTASTGFETTLRAVKQKAGKQYNIGSPLKFYRKEDAGIGSSKTLGMEVLMPHYFKEYFGVDMEIRPDGIYNKQGEKVGDQSLLEVIGFRIPTDGLHSIEFIKVKGFLPEKSGSQIVVPAELVTKSGSDFDIDKLTLYFPAYRIDGRGKIRKKEYLEGAVDENGYATEKTLQKFYDDKYGPTLNFIKDLDRELTEAKRYRREDKYTGLGDAVDRLMVAIFAEKAFSDEEMKVLENTFNADKNLSEDKRLDSIVNQYKELQKRVKDIPTFTQFKKENKEKTIEQLNDKGAIQNRIMDISKMILEDANSYEQLLSPIGVDILKKHVTRLRELNPKLDPGSPSYAELISLAHVLKTGTSFWSGQAGLGIAAVNSTHVVKSQQAGLFIPANTTVESAGESYKPSINFAGFDASSNGGEISLARQYAINEKGQNSDELITGIMSELVNAYVDVADDPFIFDLNAVPEASNAMFFLIRAGVPTDKVFTFLNQPIIRDYFTTLKDSSSKFLEIKGANVSKRKVRDYIASLYTEKLNGKASPTRTMFTLAQLESMVGIDVSKMSPQQAADQLQILKDFLQYDAVGSKLSTLVNAQSFDTNPSKGRHHTDLMLAKESEIMESGYFGNADKIYGLTHVGAFRNTTAESKNMFNMFFITSQLKNTTPLENIKKVFTNQSIVYPEKDRIYGMREAENDFITAALQGLMRTTDASGKRVNVGSIYNRIDELFMGPNSLPVRLQKLQQDPRMKKNPFIEGLIPIITKEVNDTNNLQYMSKILSTYESNVLYDAFMELPITVQNDLIDFAILQSGISTTPQSFLSIIPNDIYAARAVEVIKILRKRNKLPNLDNFYNNFWKNNAENARIVPRLPRNFTRVYKGKQFPKIPAGHAFNQFPFVSISREVITDPKERKERIAKGRTLPKKIVLFQRVDGNWVEVDKMGNGRFLKEYPPTQEKSLLDKNTTVNTGLAQLRANEKDPLPSGYTTNVQNGLRDERIKFIAANKGVLRTQRYELEDGTTIPIANRGQIQVKDLNTNEKKANFANRLGFSGGWDALVKAINGGIYPISPKWLSNPNWKLDLFDVGIPTVMENTNSSIDPNTAVSFNTISIDALGGFASKDPTGGAIGRELYNSYSSLIVQQIEAGNKTFVIPLMPGSGMIAIRAALAVQRTNPGVKIIGVQSFNGIEATYPEEFKSEFRMIANRLKSNGNTIVTRGKKYIQVTNKAARSKAHKSRDQFINANTKNSINMPFEDAKEIARIKENNKKKSENCN